MLTCQVCPHHCRLKEAQVGLCQARVAQDGKSVAIQPELMSAVALDPIEKKPLAHFYSGKMILSFGGFGCNMRCSFCQNADISFSPQPTDVDNYPNYSPQALVELALRYLPQANIGIAFTYNEPLLRYEYILACFRLAREAGLKTVLITNGCFEEDVIRELAKWTDAWNIDLKAFTEEAYRTLGGNLGSVKKAIELASEQGHVEITSLIVPGLNDDPSQMHAQAQWLAEINPEMVLHINRFFPRHLMQRASPTALKYLLSLRDIASTYLQTVLLGNV